LGRGRLGNLLRSEFAWNKVDSQGAAMAKPPKLDTGSLGVRERMLLFCIGRRRRLEAR
jgi:hypothetical protein